MFTVTKILFNNLKRNNYLKNFLRFKNAKKSDEEIKAAEKIKQLHYDNKYLFGEKVKEKPKSGKTKNVNKATRTLNEGNDPANANDMSTEIYWMTQHVPIMDFTKPAKKKSSKSKQTDTIVKPKVPKKIRKKIVQPEVKLPTETIEELEDLPKPIKVNIKSSLETSFQSKVNTLFETQSKHLEQLEIPFETVQLKSLINFPLTMKSKLTKSVSSFIPIEGNEKTQSIIIPSVSKVLQSTMPAVSRNALMQWKALKIAELGLEGFNSLQQSHLDRGKQLHHCLHKHFSGDDIDEGDIETIEEIWDSIKPALEIIHVPGVLMEEKVMHPFLYYRGVVDCVSYYDSTLAVIEWKKSDRQKKKIDYTYDAPLQLCSYLGALNTRPEFKDNPITTGVVVVAYNDGTPADVFKLTESDLKKYWRLYLHRLQEYWIRYRDNTLPTETL